MFKILKKNQNCKLRLGEIALKHGKIKTPFFMPDATRATIKNTGMADIAKLDLPALVVNTFHLYLQPGTALIKKAGGVNKFMNYSRPLLSDSGGYQVFSLIHRNKAMGRISDEQAEFRSPLDGSKHVLTPEKSIQIQFDLGVDMMVCLDDCPPNDFSRPELEKSVKRTLLWAKRSKQEYLKQLKKRKIPKRARPLIFGVIQGGAELDLREQCTKELLKLDLDGYGFGARPVDKDGNFLSEVLQFTADLIPADKLRFALGIGAPEDIVRCALMGWDMFDCVIPTREGRHGRLFRLTANCQIKTNKHKEKEFYNAFNINNKEFKNDFSPVNSKSGLPELKKYTKAYLHHLFKIKDPLGQRLASLNNLEFYAELMKIMQKRK